MPLQTSRTYPSWIIGSAPDCDIVVNQPAVSSRHCQLSQFNGSFVLEDLGSTNGTFVNGERVQPQSRVTVSCQDQITLGLTTPIPWPIAGHTLNDPSVVPPSGVKVISIGRAPESNVRLDYPMISWTHARITQDTGGSIIEDLGSTNGTALNVLDNKIQRARLQLSDEVYFGSFKIPARRLVSGEPIAQGESAFDEVRFRGDKMILGRDPSCDYPLPYPMISWRHVRLERAADGVYVDDLASQNGTYLNGVRITSKTLMRPGQEIGLGSFRFRLLEDGALAKREYAGNVTIEVSSVAVNAPNGDRLLEPVSLTIFPFRANCTDGSRGRGEDHVPEGSQRLYAARRGKSSLQWGGSV